MSRVTRSRGVLTDENAPSRNGRFTRQGTGGLKAQGKAQGLKAQGLKAHGLKTYGNTRKAPGRAALGDISNRVKQPDQREDRLAKKKKILRRPRGDAKKKIVNVKVKDVNRTSVVNVAKVAAPKPRPVEIKNSMSMDKMIADVDMRVDEPDQVTFNLEDSVSELSLSNDKTKDPLVKEYVGEIIEYFRSNESLRQASPSYMSRQSDINAKMREILIDWLVEVHVKFKLSKETLFLTVSVIDRFLERRAVSRTKLQLVGCTGMLIASKYEEIWAPEVCDFVYISDRAYTREQILAMETIMLNTLEFNLTVPSSLRFSEHYNKIAGANLNLEVMTNYLMELTLQEYKFLRYYPSMVSAAALYLGTKMLTGQVNWTEALERSTKYTEEALNPCVRDMYAVLTKQNVKYRAVRKKYSQSRMMKVATIAPCEPIPVFESSVFEN